jgi:hypothetical protein
LKQVVLVLTFGRGLLAAGFWPRLLAAGFSLFCQALQLLLAGHRADLRSRPLSCRSCAGFFAATFLAAGSAAFLGAGLFAVDFLAAGFFAAGLFAAGFLAAGFLAAGFFAVAMMNSFSMLMIAALRRRRTPKDVLPRRSFVL